MLIDALMSSPGIWAVRRRPRLPRPRPNRSPKPPAPPPKRLSRSISPPPPGNGPPPLQLPPPLVLVPPDGRHGRGGSAAASHCPAAPNPKVLRAPHRPLPGHGREEAAWGGALLLHQHMAAAAAWPCARGGDGGAGRRKQGERQQSDGADEAHGGVVGKSERGRVPSVGLRSCARGRPGSSRRWEQERRLRLPLPCVLACVGRCRQSL